MTRGVQSNSDYPTSQAWRYVKNIYRCEKCDFQTPLKKWLQNHKQKDHSY